MNWVYDTKHTHTNASKEVVRFGADKNGIENEIGNGNEVDKAKEEFASLVNRAISALRSGQLPKMIAELAQVYLQLEEFYMGESTSKVWIALSSPLFPIFLSFFLFLKKKKKKKGNASNCWWCWLTGNQDRRSRRGRLDDVHGR